MSPEQTIESYADFAVAIERRPAGLSPLSWTASRPDRKPVWSYWLLRWAQESRS